MHGPICAIAVKLLLAASNCLPRQLIHWLSFSMLVQIDGLRASVRARYVAVLGISCSCTDEYHLRLTNWPFSRKNFAFNAHYGWAQSPANAKLHTHSTHETHRIRPGINTPTIHGARRFPLRIFYRSSSVLRISH